MGWRIQIDVVGEEQADEILEVLKNAEEECEITFAFDTYKIPLEEDDS